MPGRRAARVLGWLVALNALALLGATVLPAPLREATARFALWCGLG